MKNFIKILPLFALALLATPAVQAAETDTPPAEQPRPRIKHMKENRLKQLDEKLHLTADQKAQIGAIWDKAEQDARAAHKDDAASADDRKARRREAMQAIHEQVRGVLTDEQRKIFDEMPRGNPNRNPTAEPAPAPAAGQGTE